MKGKACSFVLSVCNCYSFDLTCETFDDFVFNPLLVCHLFSVAAGFSHRRSRSSDGLLERMCSHAHRKVRIHTTKPFLSQDVFTVDRNYKYGTLTFKLTVDRLTQTLCEVC